MEHFTRGLGAELVFAIEACGARAAMVRLVPDPPPLLFAGHLQGDQPILFCRVEDHDQTIAELRARRVELGVGFEIPHRRGVEITNAGPQRVAVYERPGGRRATRRTTRLLET